MYQINETNNIAIINIISITQIYKKLPYNVWASYIHIPTPPIKRGMPPYFRWVNELKMKVYPKYLYPKIEIVWLC